MKHLFFVLFSFLFFACKKNNEAPQPALDARSYQNIAYGSHASQKMDIYLPAGRNSDSTRFLIMVHGGAWVEGDKNDLAPYVEILKQRLPGFAIFNINYRLGTLTENHFPSQEMDMQSALEFILQNTEEYHISDKGALLGMSAGAHMVLLQSYKQANPEIKAVVDLFGPADMTDLYNQAADPLLSYALQILMEGTPSTNPTLYLESSPIEFVSSLSPPTLILHGGIDPIVPVSQSINLQVKLQNLNIPNELVIYDNEGHGWTGASMENSLDRIESFLKLYVK